MQLRGSRFKFPSRLSSNLDKNWADERTILKDIKKDSLARCDCEENCFFVKIGSEE